MATVTVMRGEEYAALRRLRRLAAEKMERLRADGMLADGCRLRSLRPP